MRTGILSIPGALLEGVDVIIFCLISIGDTESELFRLYGYCLAVNQFSLCSKLHSLSNDFILFTAGA